MLGVVMTQVVTQPKFKTIKSNLLIQLWKKILQGNSYIVATN